MPLRTSVAPVVGYVYFVSARARAIEIIGNPRLQLIFGSTTLLAFMFWLFSNAQIPRPDFSLWLFAALAISMISHFLTITFFTVSFSLLGSNIRFIRMVSVYFRSLLSTTLFGSAAGFALKAKRLASNTGLPNSLEISLLERLLDVGLWLHLGFIVLIVMNDFHFGLVITSLFFICFWWGVFISRKRLLIFLWHLLNKTLRSNFVRTSSPTASPVHFLLSLGKIGTSALVLLLILQSTASDPELLPEVLVARGFALAAALIPLPIPMLVQREGSFVALLILLGVPFDSATGIAGAMVLLAFLPTLISIPFEITTQLKNISIVHFRGRRRPRK